MTGFIERYRKRRERQEAADIRQSYLDAYRNAPLIENSVMLEARDGDAIDGNIYYILRELLTDPAYAEFRIMVSVTGESVADIIETKLSPVNSSRIEFLTVGSREYYRAFATAEFLVNDATISNFYIKKEGQKYLNVWHGTPLKNMGRRVAHEPHAVGIAQKNFLAADYLLYPSEYMRDLMIDAYNMENTVTAAAVMSGYPRNSVFFDEVRRDELRAEIAEELKIPTLDSWNVYMYMPTWRPSMMGDELSEIMRQFDRVLTDQEIMYVKIHPLAASSVNFLDYKHIRKAPDCYETYEFLNIADCLITDYSSVLFDFAVTGRNIVLFTYDEKEYLSTRGLNIELDELPFPRTSTVAETVIAMRDLKTYDDVDFLKKFCPYESADAAENLCRFFFRGETCINTESIPDNGLPNVLICADDLGRWDNFDKVLDYLDRVDLKAKNYYLLFNKSEIEPNAGLLLDFPEDAGFIGYTGKMYPSRKCSKALEAYRRGEIDIQQLVKRFPEDMQLEYRRRYCSMRCDEVEYLGNPVIR